MVGAIGLVMCLGSAKAVWQVLTHVNCCAPYCEPMLSVYLHYTLRTFEMTRPTRLVTSYPATNVSAPYLCVCACMCVCVCVCVCMCCMDCPMHTYRIHFSRYRNWLVIELYLGHMRDVR